MATPINTDLGGITLFDCYGDPTILGTWWKKWKGSNQCSIEKSLTATLQVYVSARYIYFTFPPAWEPGQRAENVYSNDGTVSSIFSPQVKVLYDRHLFGNTSQLPLETIDQYIIPLRQRAVYSEFGGKTDEQILDQVIEKCISHHLRRKLLERANIWP